MIVIKLLKFNSAPRYTNVSLAGIRTEDGRIHFAPCDTTFASDEFENPRFFRPDRSLIQVSVSRDGKLLNVETKEELNEDKFVGLLGPECNLSDRAIAEKCEELTSYRTQERAKEATAQRIHSVRSDKVSGGYVSEVVEPWNSSLLQKEIRQHKRSIARILNSKTKEFSEERGEDTRDLEELLKEMGLDEERPSSSSAESKAEPTRSRGGRKR